LLPYPHPPARAGFTSLLRRARVLALLSGLCAAGTLALPAQAPAAIDVSASVAGCDGSGDQVSCEIDIGFGSVDGADRYTAAVRGPDGSVQELGEVAGGSASLTVVYVGDGTYSVIVSAWANGDRQARDAASPR
jgi:hypothetical protein